MDRTVRVLILKNAVEANLLEEVLNEKKIPFLVRSFHDLAYDGLWQTETAWGQLDAPEQYKEEILKIYNDISLPDNLIENPSESN